MHLSEGARILMRETKQIQSRKSHVSHSMSFSYPAALAAATFACGMLTQSETADAVPSFARQTGYYCSTCHTVQPELTPFGRQFKLNGYTQGGTRCGDIRKVFGNSASNPEWSGANLSMWLLPSFNHFAKDLPAPSAFPGSSIEQHRGFFRRERFLQRAGLLQSRHLLPVQLQQHRFAAGYRPNLLG